MKTPWRLHIQAFPNPFLITHSACCELYCSLASAITFFNQMRHEITSSCSGKGNEAGFFARVNISRCICSSRADPDYAIFLSQFDSSGQGGGYRIQLAKDSHHAVVCVIRGRIKRTVSQQNQALTFLILRRISNPLAGDARFGLKGFDLHSYLKNQEVSDTGKISAIWSLKFFMAPVFASSCSLRNHDLALYKRYNR